MNQWNLHRRAVFWPRRFSDDSLTQKASLNVLAAALDYGARLLVGFMITPLMVSGLGDYYFGAWQILGRAVGYLSPASGRANQTLKLTLANRQSSRDFSEKQRYVGSALAVWIIFFPFLAMIGGLISWFIPSLLKATEVYTWPIRWASGLLVAGLIISSLAEIPKSVLQGENLGYKRMGLSAVFVLIGGGLTWLFLYMGAGLIGVSAAALTTHMLTGILFLMVARKHVPWFGIAKPSLADSRDFLSLSGWLIVWHLCMKVMLASDVVLLGIFSSVGLVSSYTLTKYVPEILLSLIAMVVFGISPGLGRIIGSGDLSKAAALRGEIMSLSWLAFTTVGSTVLIWNWAFIGLWVGAGYYTGTLSMLLIVIVVIQFVLIRNDANVIDLTLSLPRKVLIGAFSAVLSVVIAGVLISRFDMGIIGLCIGLIAGRAILSVGYPLMVGRLLKISFSSQLRSVLRPAIVSILLLSCASKAGSILCTANYHLASGWPGFVCCAGITFALLLIVCFFGGLPTVKRFQILNRFHAVTGMLPSKIIQ